MNPRRPQLLGSGSYTAGAINHYRKTSGLPAMGSNSDWHFRNQSEFLRMMELARSFDRNDPIIGPALNRVVDNVLQNGFHPDPQTGDAQVDELLKERWRAWAGNPVLCDRARRLNFHGIERLVLRSVLVDGDILQLPLQTGELQAVEAHRLRTPNYNKRDLVHGVLLNKMTGGPEEYWITREDVGIHTVLKNDDMVQIPAFRDNQPAAFHVYFPRRFSQSRGVTSMAAVVDYVGMNDDANFATMVARKIQSCFAILEELPPGTEVVDAGAHGSEGTTTLADGSVTTIDDIMPGMRQISQSGGKIQGFSPNVPSQNFMEHSLFILQVISINHDIPLQVLLLDPSKTNFSGWRGALDEARKAFRRIQQDLIARFHGHVWRWKVAQWLDDESLLQAAAGKMDIYKHRWNPPAWRYIEPNKDAEAEKDIIANHLNSPRRVFNDRGLDYDEVMQEWVQDRTRLITSSLDAAREINQQYPEAEVDWREVANLAPAKTAGGSEGKAKEKETEVEHGVAAD